MSRVSSAKIIHEMSSDDGEGGRRGKTCDIIGRVMKRRAFSSFSVLELIVTSISGERTCAPLNVSAVLALQAEDGEGAVGQLVCPQDVYDMVRSNVRIGDAVTLTGMFRASPSCVSELDSDASTVTSIKSLKIGFKVGTAQILEKWDAQKLGEIYYDKSLADVIIEDVSEVESLHGLEHVQLSPFHKAKHTLP